MADDEVPRVIKHPVAHCYIQHELYKLKFFLNFYDPGPLYTGQPSGVRYSLLSHGKFLIKTTEQHALCILSAFPPVNSIRSKILLTFLKGGTMNRTQSLDRETQLLIAAGSAVAAGCITCLETIVEMARTEGIDERKLREAVMTGQFVKEQPNNHMKEVADELLGTHLQSRSLYNVGECPLSKESGTETQTAPATKKGDTGSGGCRCS
jgi:alkylhydroperoxidase/carboxymuconolactone decarboxylase family protein YurZ